MKPELKKRLDAARAKHAAQIKALADLKAAQELKDKGATTVGVTDPDLVAKIKGLETTVRDLEAAQRARPSQTTVSVEEPTAKNFSFTKALVATSDRRFGGKELSIFDSKGWEDSPNELAVLRKGWMGKYAPGAKTWAEAETMTKAMSFMDTSSAGGLVPVTLMTEIIGLNRSQDCVSALGISEKTGLVGNVEWNRRISGTTFRPISENPSSSPTVDDLAYTKIQLSPKEFVGFCKLSNKLKAQAGSVIETEIRDDLGGAWVESRNSNVLAGTGVGGYPLGVINRPTGSGQGLMNTVATFTTLAAAIPKLWSMVSAIREDKNAIDGLKWALHPNDWYDLVRAGEAQTTAAAAGTAFRPLFQQGDPAKGVTAALCGYPVVLCDEMTEGTMVLGDWKMVYLGTWSGVSLAMSDQAGTAFEYNQTWVRMIYDTDVAIAKPSALCTGTSVAFA